MKNNLEAFEEQPEKMEKQILNTGRRIVTAYLQVFFLASLFSEITKGEISGSLFIAAFLGALILVGFEVANEYLDERIKNRILTNKNNNHAN